MAGATLIHASPISARTSRADRRALAVLLPVGPLAVAILRGILPYYTTDSNTVLAARVAAHQGAEQIVLWLTVIAILTLIPAVITAGLMARRGAPRLGTAGLVLSFAGLMFLGSPSIAGPDTVALGAARIGMAPGTVGRLLSSIGALGPVSLGSALFVAGHVIGLILLGIALWRRRGRAGLGRAGHRGIADRPLRIRRAGTQPPARRLLLGPDRDRIRRRSGGAAQAIGLEDKKE